MVEILKYIVMAGFTVLAIHKLYQIWKAKKRNPQDDTEIRLLWIELWLYMILILIYVNKTIWIFIGLYVV